MMRRDYIRMRSSTEADIYFSVVISRLEVKVCSKIETDKEPEPLYVSQDIIDIETFLDQSEIACLSVETSQSSRLRFLNCLVKEEVERKKFLLVRDFINKASSLY